MRFGLFSGAAAKRTDETSDSQLYGEFVDYVCEAEQRKRFSDPTALRLDFLVDRARTRFVRVVTPRGDRWNAVPPRPRA
jgi:hypothetical protein